MFLLWFFLNVIKKSFQEKAMQIRKKKRETNLLF